MDTKEALLACADYLEEHGWCQHGYSSIEGAADRCSIGVIDTISEGFPHPVCSDAYQAMRDALAAHLELNGETRTIIGWNDAPGRTKEEVVTAFRAAAEAVES